MQQHEHKSHESKNRSAATQRKNPQTQNSSTFQFVDNRPKSIQTQKMFTNDTESNSIGLVDNRPKVAQLKRIQNLMNTSSRTTSVAQLQKMQKAYRFDDEKPPVGATVYAFRSLGGLKQFANMQGDKGSQKFWEIEGEIVEDDGTEDGIRIKVTSANEVE